MRPSYQSLIRVFQQGVFFVPAAAAGEAPMPKSAAAATIAAATTRSLGVYRDGWITGTTRPHPSGRRPSMTFPGCTLRYAPLGGWSKQCRDPGYEADEPV